MNPNNNKEWKTSATAFVDDARLFSNIPRHLHQSVSTALQYLQQASQYWEHLLHSSGGKLEYGKCAFYILSWIFHDDGTATMDKSTPHTLPITSSNTGRHTDIKQLQPNEPMTYLGYTSQPDGNQNPQLNKHIAKANSFARLISTSNMTRHQTHTSSQSIVNSTLTHILSSTSYNDLMIDKIQRQIHPTIITGTGFNKHWPKALRYGNHNIGSLRLKHLGTEQMIRKIDIIHKFITLPDYSNLILSLIDNYQLAAGLTTPILENINGDTSYVTSIWLNNLIQDLQHHNIKLSIRDKFTLTPDRYNDTNIMQSVNNKYKSLTKRKQYNACRMYLRITFLSELCNPEGTSLNITLLNNKSNYRVRSRFWWPNQTKPGVKYWNEWISYLKQTYCVPNSHHLQHRYLLGKWLTTYNNRNSHFNLNFSPSLQEIYDTKQCTQQYCQHIGAGTYSLTPSTIESLDTIPADAIPITIQNNTFNCTVQRQYNRRASPIATTFSEYINALPSWKQILIQKSYISYPTSLAMELDAKRTLLIATDGTKTDTTSGGGWLISTTLGKLTAHGGNPIFGNNESMHSHRSEIYAALALFTFLNEYCKYYQIKTTM